MRNELENPMVIGDYYRVCERCGTALLSVWEWERRRASLCPDCDQYRLLQNSENSKTTMGKEDAYGD